MSYIVIAIIGLLGGLASGLFGVGGGAVFVPLLIILRNWDPHLAVGTSLSVVVPTALLAAAVHGRAGMIDWKTAGLLAVFALLGAWFGAGLSLKLDILVLRRYFALFLFVMAFKLFFQK